MYQGIHLIPDSIFKAVKWPVLPHLNNKSFHIKFVLAPSCFADFSIPWTSAVGHNGKRIRSFTVCPYTVY